MAKTFKDKDEALAWREEQDTQAPKEGDEAPDFTLSDIQGEHPLQLSKLRGDQPVALVFGSFT